ncbi:hypothetical protein AKJ09_08355 [Labilithrix luteola]|uniref:Lipoprotein n=1 Tax=Labilithrix luteola TaxID=1391654 RepID=A0A0K1Q7Q1_9BACT|nr:hypothetical protein [Labilithrix luteola]AKV01692.1 hypothetical protein AKJ09_08355 [Labilithrix luteola]
MMRARLVALLATCIAQGCGGLRSPAPKAACDGDDFGMSLLASLWPILGARHGD